MRSLRLFGLWGALGFLVASGPGRAAPAPAPPDRPAASAPAGPPRTFPRLALALYYYWYQADPRKPAPLSRVRGSDGASALTSHPWDGAGPWFSYDRVQWHKNQLALIRDTAIDVILPVYTGDGAGSPYAIKGLNCLAQALKEIRSAGSQPYQRERGYPLVGMWLDLRAVRETVGGPVDLKTENGRRALYGAIRTFYRHIPPQFRASVALPPEQAGRRAAPGSGAAAAPGAHIVIVTGAAAVREWDDAAAAYCSQRFAADFGAGLVWVGAADLKGRSTSLDGYLETAVPGAPPAAAAPAPAVRPGPGWLKVVTVQPSAPPAQSRAPTAGSRERMGGQTLIQSFLAALRSGADWLVVDNWNQFQEGTDVAPSHEFGLQPRDLTDAGLTQFKAGGDFGAIILRAAVPEQVAPRTLYQVEVLVENTGQKGWGAANRAGLSYRWFKDGKPAGDAGPLVAAASIAPGEAKIFTIGLTSPMSGGRPLPDGRYELRLDMMVPPNQWFAGPESAPLSVSVEVGRPPPYRPAWLGTDLPTLLKAGATYTATLRVRNDGAEVWRKARGTAIGYRWRRVTPFRGAATPESDQAINAAMVSVPLPADVPPGAVVPLPITVKVADDQGAPLTAWSPRESWSYDLEWGFFDGEKWLSGEAASPYREGVAVLPVDLGPSFLGVGLANELPAGKVQVTKVGLRNTGPDTWKMADARVGYHWYYFDGTEAVWSGGTAALPKDVRPEETVIASDLAVKIPDYNGPMYLVFDLQVGGSYASTSANTRGSDILVLPTLITGGRMAPVDLTNAFNADGISHDNSRADGDLDGTGTTLAAETLPPYVWRPSLGAASLQTNLYPCGLWARPVGTYPTPAGPINESVTFRYPDKRDRAKNMVSCAGQRIELSTGPVAALHLLGCATAPNAAGAFTIVYKDGATTAQQVAMSLWSGPPKHGEHIAFHCLGVHTPQGDDPARSGYLNHYILRVDNSRPVAALVLPQNTALKLFAITAEGLEARPATLDPGIGLRLPPQLRPK